MPSLSDVFLLGLVGRNVKEALPFCSRSTTSLRPLESSLVAFLFHLRGGLGGHRNERPERRKVDTLSVLSMREVYHRCVRRIIV